MPEQNLQNFSITATLSGTDAQHDQNAVFNDRVVAQAYHVCSPKLCKVCSLL